MEPVETHYDAIGGAHAVTQLVDRFYELMDTAPEAVHVRALHATSLKVSREKLRLFLTGWLDGPQLYVEKHGPPMLRRRHFPFAIGTVERDEWVWCMTRALAEQPMADDLRAYLTQRMVALAEHMRNQPE